MRYLAPLTLEEALEDLAAGAVPLAGGTDLLVAWEQRPHPAVVCDLGRVPELSGIAEVGGRIVIGALTTHAEVLRSPLLGDCANVLVEAARSIGALQVRARGTVGGNLANASPAADLTTALLALDAEVELCGSGGRRRLPVASFVRGNRLTARLEGEILTAVSFARPKDEVSAYEKLGLRAAQAISVVSLAIRLRHRAGVVSDAALALGSVAPAPIRVPAAEAALRGRPLDAAVVAEARKALEAAGTPIDDVRASAEYRRAMAGVLLERVLERAGLLRSSVADAPK
jgi:CO/xanthine dehydrogenase FAD-binding subunit